MFCQEVQHFQIVYNSGDTRTLNVSLRDHQFLPERLHIFNIDPYLLQHVYWNVYVYVICIVELKLETLFESCLAMQLCQDPLFSKRMFRNYNSQ